MEIILVEDVTGVGQKGAVVNVKPGFARNYLLPRKLALEVTPSNMKMVDLERKALKKKVEAERLSYRDLIAQLNAVSLSFARKAGEKDHIFGSVSAGDIKEQLDKLGFEIDKKKIVLDEPIKRLGNYTVAVKVFHDDKAEVKVAAVKEEEPAAEPPAEPAPAAG